MILLTTLFRGSLPDLLPLIIIMEICKAPTLPLKALNKHSIKHIMYIEMEMLSAIKIKNDVCMKKEKRKSKT